MKHIQYIHDDSNRKNLENKVYGILPNGERELVFETKSLVEASNMAYAFGLSYKVTNTKLNNSPEFLSGYEVIERAKNLLKENPSTFPELQKARNMTRLESVNVLTAFDYDIQSVHKRPYIAIFADNKNVANHYIADTENNDVLSKIEELTDDGTLYRMANNSNDLNNSSDDNYSLIGYKFSAIRAGRTPKEVGSTLMKDYKFDLISSMTPSFGMR